MRRRPPDQGKGARGGKASAARVVESAFPTRRRPASHLPLQLPRADAARLLASGSFRDGRDSLRAAWCKAEAERPPLPRPARREPAGGTWHWGCPLSAAFRARRSSACARRSQRCRRSPSPPSLAVPTPASSCAHEPLLLLLTSLHSPRRDARVLGRTAGSSDAARTRNSPARPEGQPAAGSPARARLAPHTSRLTGATASAGALVRSAVVSPRLALIVCTPCAPVGRESAADIEPGSRAPHPPRAGARSPSPGPPLVRRSPCLLCLVHRRPRHNNGSRFRGPSSALLLLLLPSPSTSPSARPRRSYSSAHSTFACAPRHHGVAVPAAAVVPPRTCTHLPRRPFPVLEPLFRLVHTSTSSCRQHIGRQCRATPAAAAQARLHRRRGRRGRMRRCGGGPRSRSARRGSSGAQDERPARCARRRRAREQRARPGRGERVAHGERERGAGRSTGVAALRRGRRPTAREAQEDRARRRARARRARAGVPDGAAEQEAAPSALALELVALVAVGRQRRLPRVSIAPAFAVPGRLRHAVRRGRRRPQTLLDPAARALSTPRSRLRPPRAGRLPDTDVVV